MILKKIFSFNLPFKTLSCEKAERETSWMLEASKETNMKAKSRGYKAQDHLAREPARKPLKFNSKNRSYRVTSRLRKLKESQAIAMTTIKAHSLKK